MREVQVAYLDFRGRRVGLDDEFEHLGVAARQALDRLYVGRHREAEDVARRDQLLVDDRVDAHALGQVDEVQVLDLGDHFLHAEPFGQHRGQNVRLGAARHGHEGVHIAQSLFDHRFGIAPVFVDNQCFFELLGQFVGLFGRIVDQLDVDFVLQFGRHARADAAAAQNHHVLDVDIGLAREYHDVFDRMLVRDHVDVVADLELVAAARDDRFSVARDGDRAVGLRLAVVGNFEQRLVDQRRRGVDLEHDERQLAAREVDVFGRARVAEQVDHLVGRHLLGVEQVVDAHVDEHLLVVRFQILVVVDPGDRLTRAELLGQYGRDDVRRLLGPHGDEQIRLAYRGFLQYRERRAVSLDDDYVGHAGDRLEPLGIVVHDRDVVIFPAQHLGQMAAHLARSGNYDFHVLYVSFRFRKPACAPSPRQTIRTGRSGRLLAVRSGDAPRIRPVAGRFAASMSEPVAPVGRFAVFFSKTEPGLRFRSSYPAACSAGRGFDGARFGTAVSGNCRPGRFPSALMLPEPGLRFRFPAIGTAESFATAA